MLDRSASHTILATNSSYIVNSHRPGDRADRVLNMHF